MAAQSQPRPQAPRPPSSYPSRRSDSHLVSIPKRSWAEVIQRVDRLWIPENAPHHSIFGQNGSGKSYLIVNGIMPLIADDKVLFIDSKGGDDPVINSAGMKRVRNLPRQITRTAMDDGKPRSGWYQLVVSDDVPTGRRQVASALERVYDEGQWTVILDETRAISDPRSPGLGLQPLLDRLWLRGRSRRICVVAATQAPRWVPTSFYDQCQFAWCSRIRDDRAHERIMEIGSMTRAHIPHIANIRKRRWLFMDDEEDETWLAETGITASRSSRRSPTSGSPPS